MEFFQCHPVNKHVTRISDPTGVYAYLVEGSQKAILIDTCSGVGNLKKFVEGLTAKPLSVICTHGHVDHAGGAFGFDEVFLNTRDNELVWEHTSVELRRGYVESSLGQGKIPLEDYVPKRNGGYLEITDGQEFALGGMTLEAVALPGHTQGMICILIRELRCLLLGDGCNNFTFLFGPEASSVREYKKSLEDLLLKHGDRFDFVWFSHGPFAGTKAIIAECIDLCDQIMDGSVDNVPFDFMELTAFIARAINPDISRVDGKTGNIVYNPAKIFG